MGEKLRELRLGIGYTQKQVAAVFGISVYTISRLENGKHQPSFKLLHSLLDLYGYSFADFVSEYF